MSHENDTSSHICLISATRTSFHKLTTLASKLISKISSSLNRFSKRVHDDEEVEEGKVKNRKRDFSSIYISSIPPRIREDLCIK